MTTKDKLEKKVLKNPLSRCFYLVEVIHKLPTFQLQELKTAIDMELQDRKYKLNEGRSWVDKMFKRMELK